ncbi:hypothetical protein Spb1_01090 [Planctopirus ephydatiae]|jgi:uncharacterized protein (TIGR03067 family)|uniref:Uncharacterized protein n=1 Tax=Planctopirus ephydatiae TaxID=2528019 RepID=A0A518GI23_9PLAN|nr:hypothetical protein [Planctopirus ephydatiae]QDV28246.1 hypothetical protein Spb1_01090 [Planctopirus ephydatiae]
MVVACLVSGSMIEGWMIHGWMSVGSRSLQASDLNLTRISGTWQVDSATTDVLRSTVLPYKDYLIEIDGNKVRIEKPDSILPVATLGLRVKPGRLLDEPMQFDLYDAQNNHVYQGIYRLNGSQLELCLAPYGKTAVDDNRPENFIPKTGDGATLVRLHWVRR